MLKAVNGLELLIGKRPYYYNPNYKHNPWFLEKTH